MAGAARRRRGDRDEGHAGRSGPPGAIAHAVVYLASDEAWFVHGTLLDVDGGCLNVAVFAGAG